MRAVAVVEMRVQVQVWAVVRIALMAAQRMTQRLRWRRQ
jgi:hypothetical protein